VAAGLPGLIAMILGAMFGADFGARVALVFLRGRNRAGRLAEE